MNQATATVAILAGALVGGGLFLLVGFFMGVDMLPDRPGSSGSLRDSLKGLSGRLIASLVVGLGVLLLTRWIVLAVAAGLLVIVWPLLFGGAKQEKLAAAKIEALATWAESLRDTIAGAVGLEQAIPATVYAAAPVLREDLALLADRMRVRVPLPTALRQFADDLDDPTADLIVSALIMNARLRGPRRSAQIVVVFSIVVMLGLAVFNRSFVAPYSSVQGQLVLVVVVALFAVGMLWMRRLAGVQLPRRFLTVSAQAGGENA